MEVLIETSVFVSLHLHVIELFYGVWWCNTDSFVRSEVQESRAGSPFCFHNGERESQGRLMFLLTNVVIVCRCFGRCFQFVPRCFHSWCAARLTPTWLIRLCDYLASFRDKGCAPCHRVTWLFICRLSTLGTQDKITGAAATRSPMFITPKNHHNQRRTTRAEPCNDCVDWKWL